MQIHRTFVHGTFECDTHIPSTIPAQFVRQSKGEPMNCIKEENGVKYEFQVFTRSDVVGDAQPQGMLSTSRPLRIRSSPLVFLQDALGVVPYIDRSTN